MGNKRKKDDDAVQNFDHEIRYPATTQADKLAAEIDKQHDSAHMSVLYSTYHSIDVISKAQHQFNLADFDLIICDEAHRTTGSKFTGEDESNFVKVHDGVFIKAQKRLYMTVTPCIFGVSGLRAFGRYDSMGMVQEENPVPYHPGAIKAYKEMGIWTGE